MGVDKRRLQLEGRTLLDIAVGKVSALCDEVVVAGGATAQRTIPGTSWVKDCPALSGPAAGIAAGLDAIGNSRALVLACDMPFVTEALMQSLLTTAEEGWLAVVPKVGSRWEPLCAVYATRCADLLRRECTPDRSALKVFLEGHGDEVRSLEEPELSRFGDSALLLANLNSPQDFQRAAARSRRSATAGRFAPD